MYVTRMFGEGGELLEQMALSLSLSQKVSFGGRLGWFLMGGLLMPFRAGGSGRRID